MNILYIATDVILEKNNGGSRRAYETAKIFAKKGHRSVLLVNKGEREPRYEEKDGILIYRKKLPDIEMFLRKMGKFLIEKIKSDKDSLNGPSNDNKDMIDPENPGSSKKEPGFIQKTYANYLKKPVYSGLKDLFVEFYRHRIPVHKYIKWAPALSTALKIIKRHKIDLIIERGPSYGLGALCARMTSRFYCVDFIDIMYSNWALKQADLVLSYFTTVQIPSFVPKNKIQKVWTVTDIDKFKPGPKDTDILERIGLSKDHFICIYIGGFFPWHGVDIMVEAAMRIKEMGVNDIKFVLVGKGEVWGIVSEEVKRRGLEDTVILTGKIPYEDVPRYLSVADVALSLNTGDSIGFKLLEYMACGLAIIATNADNLHYIAEDKKELLYVRLNDVDDLVQKILLLKKNADLRYQLGENARKMVETRYTWDVHYHNIIEGVKKRIKRMIE